MVTPNGSRCSAKQNFYFTTAFCILYGHSKGMRSVEEKSTNTNAVRALTFKKKPRPWIYNITPLSFTARWCRHWIFGIILKVWFGLLFFWVFVYLILCMKRGTFRRWKNSFKKHVFFLLFLRLNVTWMHVFLPVVIHWKTLNRL